MVISQQRLRDSDRSAPFRSPYLRRHGTGVAGAAADPCGELSFGAEVVNVDAQPPVHRAALHDGVAGPGTSDQSIRCDRVDADEYSTFTAGRNGQVTTDEKGEAAEHLRLRDAGLVDEELTDALGEIVVVGHSAIVGMTHLPRTGQELRSGP